jgi:Cdc6-like AAA superfamily ATPase
MNLREVYERRLFDDATTDAERRLYYVRSGELGIEPRADRQLMEHLKSEAHPQRVQVVGPSGAGKTSLIVRVLADLEAENLDPGYEVLILRVGERPEHLESGERMIKLVLDTIAAQSFRFSNVDPSVFEKATAERVTQSPVRINHEFGFNGGIASYTAQVENAFKTLEFGQNQARLRQDLEDVIRMVREGGYRPVLVLDDTEKFVAPGRNGELNTDSISNLYHHGVRVLGEFDLDLVIAMHPRFDEAPHVQEVSERLAIDQIAVPQLAPDREPAAIEKILERRLERGEVEVELTEVISKEAVGDLQLLYHERESDLRSVLKIAHAAAEQALERNSSVLEALDVRGVVAS